MAKKIIVTGGSGFIGREVCRIAATQGHEVVSISRSGRPSPAEPWMDNVRWVKGSALQPESWREHLQGAHAVIHAVATIREKPKEGLTYERVNGDAAEIAAWEAEQAGVEHFVFLSVHRNPPVVSKRFTAAKRRAEQALRGRDLRESILRPNIVYGEQRPISVALARVQQALEHLPGLHDTMQASRPLRVEQVATAAVRAATESGYEGVINVDNIAYLADGHWNQYASDRTSPRPDTTALLIGGALAGIVGGLLWARRRG